MKTITQFLTIALVGFLSILTAADFAGLNSTISATNSPSVEAENWTLVEPADGQHPTKRHETSFVKAGDRFYLLGGRGLDPVDVYDPVAQTWSERAQIPTEMHHFQAVELDGLIYTVGAFEGDCCDESPLPIVYIYDPFDDQWIEGPAISAARLRGSAGAVIYDDKIYMISGLQVGHQSGWVEWLDSYDPATNEWEALSDAPRARDHFHAGLVDDNIVVAGGRNSGRSGIFNYTIGEVDIYDISASSWSTATENLPSERAGTTAAVAGSEVLIIGGESSRTEAFAATEAFNVSTGEWRTLGSLTRARHGVQAIAYDGVIYVAAGSGQRGGSPELDTLEAFNYSGPPDSAGQPLAESSLVARRSTVDFGERLVDSDVTQELIFTNQDGNQAIVITDIQLADTTVFAYAYLNALPVVIAPKATASISLGFRPTAEQSYSTQLVVSHSGKDDSTTVTLLGSGSDASQSNQSPIVVQPVDDFSVDEDGPSTEIDLGVVFSDPDQAAATLTYSVTSSLPAVMLATVIGPSLSLRPLLNANGVVVITVQATDDEGLSATEQFSVTVNPVNDPPFITPNKNLEMREGESLNVEIIADDPDNDVLDFDVSIKPNMEIATFVLGKNNRGTLQFKPGFSDAGQHTVMVTVRDPDQLSTSHIFTIDVAERNTTPTISELPPLTVTVDRPVTMTVASTDRDGDSVTIRVPELPDFMALGATRLGPSSYLADLVIAPSEDDLGEYNVAVQAVDPSGLFAETVLSLTVESTAPLNRPPAISTVDDVTITAGLPFTLSLSVADADLSVNEDEALTVTLLGAPTGMLLNDSKLSEDNLVLVHWDGSTSAGSYPITLKVTDAGGLVDETSFVVTVEPVNAALPPQPVAGVGSLEIRIDEPYSLTVRFVDPNADPVTLRALSIPEGARFTDLGDGTGIMVWQPPEGSLGEHNVVISATDSTGLSTQQSYRLVVTLSVPSGSIYRFYLPTHQ